MDREDFYALYSSIDSSRANRSWEDCFSIDKSTRTPATAEMTSDRKFTLHKDTVCRLKRLFPGPTDLQFEVISKLPLTDRIIAQGSGRTLLNLVPFLPFLHQADCYEDMDQRVEILAIVLTTDMDRVQRMRRLLRGLAGEGRSRCLICTPAHMDQVEEASTKCLYICIDQAYRLLNLQSVRDLCSGLVLNQKLLLTTWRMRPCLRNFSICYKHIVSYGGPRKQGTIMNRDIVDPITAYSELCFPYKLIQWLENNGTPDSFTSQCLPLSFQERDIVGLINPEHKQHLLGYIPSIVYKALNRKKRFGPDILILCRSREIKRSVYQMILACAEVFEKSDLRVSSNQIEAADIILAVPGSLRLPRLPLRSIILIGAEFLLDPIRLGEETYRVLEKIEQLTQLILINTYEGPNMSRYIVRYMVRPVHIQSSLC